MKKEEENSVFDSIKDRAKDRVVKDIEDNVAKEVGGIVSEL